VRQKPLVSGNTSLKNILGDTGPPANSAWSSSMPAGENSKGGGPGGGSTDVNGDASENTTATAPAASSAAGGGKKGKGKGKAKQTLFTLGTFPS
jgi:E3 ubiquitin-protein ligase ZNF598